MLVIINYQMGNLQSVSNILSYLKISHVITSDINEIKRADSIILPGVGAFGQAMENLCKFNLIEVLNEEVINKKKPFLGICLGMQVLATKGYEGGETPGLGWIKGEARLLELNDKKLPVPHMGWNDVEPLPDKKLYNNNIKKRVCYFVHSYHLICEDKSWVSAYTDYGEKIVASVEKDNIFAMQFHPEKSQTDGLEILKNFLAYK